jgi:hypothetical protein
MRSKEKTPARKCQLTVLIAEEKVMEERNKQLPQK